MENLKKLLKIFVALCIPAMLIYALFEKKDILPTINLHILTFIFIDMIFDLPKNRAKYPQFHIAITLFSFIIALLNGLYYIYYMQSLRFFDNFVLINTIFLTITFPFLRYYLEVNKEYYKQKAIEDN